MHNGTWTHESTTHMRHTQRLMAPAEAPEAAAAAAPAGDSSPESAQTDQAPVDLISRLERIASQEASSTTEEEVEDSSVATADEEEDDGQPDPGDEPEEQQEQETDEESETETETDEQAEDEEAKDDEDPEEDPDIDLKDLDPKARKAAQKVIQREIGKIRSKKQAAEARAAELESKVNGYESETTELKAALSNLEAAKVVPKPTAQDPLSQYTSHESLERLEQDERAFSRWVTLNPDGGPCPFVLGDDKKPVELTREQVLSMKATLDEDLAVHIPRRRAFIEADAKYDANTVELFPQLKDKTHALTVAVNDILRNAPEFKRFPGARMGAVYYELGRRMVEAHKGQAWDLAVGKPAPAPKPAAQRIPVKGKHRPAPVPAASSPARVPRSKAAVATGEPLNDDAVVDSLAARFGG